MSARRSSRLAVKTSSVSSAGANSGAGLLVYEDTLAQHVDLKSRTPLNRNSQKRKRKSLDVGAVAEGKTETKNSPEEEKPAVCNTPTVLTQSSGAAGLKRLSLDESSAFSPLILENDSFLEALNKIENNEKKSQGPPKAATEDVDSQCETVCDNYSQDVFGDDADILDALPPTPDTTDHTPKRTPKRSIPSKRLSVAVAENPINPNVLPKTDFQRNGFKSAKQVLNSERSLGILREPKPAPVRKRSITSGAKNKNSGAQGRGVRERRKKNGKFKMAFTNRKLAKELANSASNELSKTDLSYLSTEEKLQLSTWGLPNSILQNYHSKGIKSLFPWQLECLANEKVLEGRNLLYSAPTSAGKTLVSEILMVKRVLELGRKAIMILPFVSVAREKVYSLQSIFGDAGIRVEGFFGSVNPPGGFKAVDIAICTIEKANSLVNKLLEEGGLADLGTLVVDELHLIGDSNRGYLLELLLTKILYMTSVKNYHEENENSLNISEGASSRSKKFNIQIVGMSATLPNLDVLAKWLNAELYVTDFRPVPLKQRLKIEDKLLDENLETVRKVQVEEIPLQIVGDVDDIVYLTLETVLNGFSVLVFCPTKQLVEYTAKKLSEDFFRIGDPTSGNYPEIGKQLRKFLNGDQIKTVLEQLKLCPGGYDETLAKVIMFGIGFHHAGLTYENRDIVESAFKRGILRVIVATSTLSAGVNLPARRVIISTPVVYNRELLDTMTYRQMCGRAGRNGIDTEGESILICPTAFKEKGLQLFKGEMPMVKSALLLDGALTSERMKRALLEAIASGIASLTTDVRSYAKCTFLFHSLDNGLYQRNDLSMSQENRETTIEECVEELEKQDFIKRYEYEEKPAEYKPTNLGSACLASALSPDEGIFVLQELSKAQKCFNLENELHIVYQVTPIYVCDQLKNIDWQEYLRIWDKLTQSEKEVANLVGVKEHFLFRAMTGIASRNNKNHMDDMIIHTRFFAALALNDLVNEKSLDYVGFKFGLSKGVLQNLQQSASTFAGMVTAFSTKLGLKGLDVLLPQFQERLEFGVQRELCELVKLDCLNGQRARILYDAGLTTIVEVAAADPAQVEHILHKATPFKSTVHGEKEGSVWIIGKETLTEAEAARKIVLEARDFIQIELGHQGNIIFAFGKNDAPMPVKSELGHHASNGNSELLMNSNNMSRDGNQISTTVSQQNERNAIELVNLELNHSGNHFARQDQRKNHSLVIDEHRDIHMEELFSQRHQELLEKSEVVPVVETNLLSEEALFEDSFPEAFSTEMSALYRKHNDDNSVGTKFSIEQEVKKVVRKTQANHQSKKDLQHSTPLLDVGADTSRRQRFTLQQDEQASPVRTISPSRNVNEKSIEADRNDFPSKENCGDLSHGLLAEFDKDFDSFGDGFDCSMEFNEQPDKVANNEVHDEQKSKSDIVKSESVPLSDSVTAAMKALAEDTDFQSEELFPDGNECVVEPVPQYTKPESGRSHGYEAFEDEDFISTQISVVSEEHIANEEHEDEFGESSSDSSSDSTDSLPLSHSDNSQSMRPTVYETMVGKVKVVTRIVKSADMIPSAFFSSCKLVGVGMKLVTLKKPSLTIAKQGIGARVIGKSPTVSNPSLPQGESLHSLALYNGTDSIWVLRWENENGLRVGGSRKTCTGNAKLEKLLDKIVNASCAVALFESKDKIKNLLKHCGNDILSKLPPGERIWDPRIAQWMLEFDDKEFNVSKGKLIDQYATEAEKRIKFSNLDKEIIEAFFACKVMTVLKEKLSNSRLWDPFVETEMPSIVPLLLMEMNGLGLDSIQLNKLKRVLQFKSALLELKAYELAGRQFNLDSPKDIKQILFREIGLKQPKGKSGTGKDVLLKLDHELPLVIVEWRKVASALSKVVIPFQQERNLETGRVHGQYSHFTVTGRVIMADPSLQCIPKDFDIQISYDPEEVDEVKSICEIKFGYDKVSALFRQLDTNVEDAYILNQSLISMRNAFIPCSEEFTILTADYSQLELRILAHLSKDKKLLEALNKDTDVFIEIASQWKKLHRSKITNTIRQEAKGIVYGVIYGMGTKALSAQMEIEEREADSFITQFMRTYPGIGAFIEKASKFCQEKGYIETMTGRRRYLPLIHSHIPHEKAKALRQAVNSQIQGSAADLVKAAMARIHSFLVSKYPKSALPVDWNKLCKARRSSLCDSDSSHLKNLVFFPILNLHDELIFEVRKTHLEEVAAVVKREMESCVKLDVKLPVVIKTGDSWGTLNIYESNSEKL